VPEEITYWSGEVTYSYGLWLTMGALAAVAVVAASELFERRSLRVGEQRETETHVG
jgi:hypothetical protein